MIRRLSPAVAVRIAAGEVIERPVSAVKELLENALDAGAHRVTIALQFGGTRSLVVEDDGGGIPPEELPLAVERYATSKISEENDLLALRTLGFRGEALASLGAVGKLEIRSRVPGSSRGAFLRLEGGQVVDQGETTCPSGTRVQVEDLFFNVPARRKFLKGAPAETRRVVGVVRDYALAYPAVAFVLFSEGKKIFASAGEGDRHSLLRQLWGGEPPPQTSTVQRDAVAVEAFFQPSPGSDALRLTAFVNGRRFSDPLLRAALASVQGQRGGEWFLALDIPPGEIDVNIHPAKVEVRFRCPREIFDAVRTVAKDLLVGPTPLRLLAKGSGHPLPEVERPFAPRSEGIPCSRVASSETFRVVRDGGTSSPEIPLAPSCREQEAPDSSGASQYLGQMIAGYLLFEDDGGLVLMDPHAAHERIRYEALEREGEVWQVQPLALPLPLPPSLGHRAAPLAPQLRELGFALEDGEGNWVLGSLPVHSRVGPLSPLDLLRRTVDLLEQGVRSPRETVWRAWASLACAGALKLGARLAPSEAQALWQDLQRCTHPDTCPHGRPVLLRLETAQLARYFGR